MDHRGARGQQGNQFLFLMNFEEDAQTIPVEAPAGVYELVLSTDDPRYGGEPGSEARQPR